MYRTVTIPPIPTIDKDDAGASVKVTVSGGDKGEPDTSFALTITRAMSKADVMAAVNAVARRQNTRDSYLDTLTAGATESLVPPDPLPPTLQQLYDRDRALRLKDKQDIDAGITTDANPVVVTNLVAAVASRDALDSSKG